MYIKKSEAFKAIKEANTYADKMKNFSEDSKEYGEYSEALYWTLEIFTEATNCHLRMSERTGHYWVTF